jgi:hypothetical protein
MNLGLDQVVAIVTMNVWESSPGGAELSSTQESPSLAPMTPKALLRVVLDLEARQRYTAGASRAARSSLPSMLANPWKLAAWTSLAWLAVLGTTAAGFMAVLERQDRQLELLLERTAPPSQAP